ncbi:MAG: DUF192 domain-containing protein [Oceanipulchritudo sp.]
MKRLLPSASLLLILLLFPGCNAGDDPAGTVAGPEVWLPLQIDTVPLSAQIALTSEEQRKGLMDRDSLPPDSGMLFPYPQPQRLSFWMANTRIPLDIGFFDSEGLLREVHRLHPYDTSSTSSRRDDLQYALEMNAGWFSANGLYPGARLDRQSLAEALRRRGADPRRFGLESD